MKIKIAGVVKNSIVDGPGIRYAVFAQGCSHNCKGCHNPQTHDKSGGEWADIAELAQEIKKDPLLDGVTFTGGEPFEQTAEFACLAELIGDIDIICYTGYTFEELYPDKDSHILLSRVDRLIDGRFDKKRKSLMLKFRGSANQRVLDSKESVRCGKAIETTL